jgi:chromosome segregation ATPase
MQTKMKAVIFAVAFGVHAVSAGTSVVTPVQKVVQMLGDMKAKGTQEMAAEKKTYESYSKFVRTQTRDLKYEIKSAKASIEKLIAKITKADADVAKLGKEIAANDAETATLEADQKAATDARTAAKDKFLAEQTDYGESLYALDRAIETLKSQEADRPQAMMLLQRMAKTMTGMRRVLATFALEQGRSEGGGAPAVNAYEFQSGGIVEMLAGLKDNFRKELADLEKEEANSAHAYDMEMVHLTNTLDNLKAEREEMAQTKGKISAESAAAKGELADTKASLAEAEKFLADTTATYQTKSSTFEANQKVRGEELEAIGKAIEIISNPNVSGSYGTHVNAELMQQPKLTLLQLHSASKQASRNEAATFLKTRAKALNSVTLAKFAATLTSGNPFDKVVSMIEDLLEKLKEEAASEADHKDYCDKELKKNKMRRNKKEAEVESLTAEIEQKAAAIADMGKKLATLAEEQASLRAEVAEATKTRGEEKQENEVAIKDSAEAQVAVQSALAVLKDFYAKQGSSFIQQVPEMEAYSGMSSAKGGVIGMLEVIQSDFARVETDTRAAESQAVSEYKAFMSEAEDTLKSKHDAEFKLGLQKDEAEFAKEQLEKNLKASSKQLDMANAYYGELKPQCIEVHVSFEERAQMRKDEIKALQEAYKILDQKGR